MTKHCTPIPILHVRSSHTPVPPPPLFKKSRSSSNPHVYHRKKRFQAKHLQASCFILFENMGVNLKFLVFAWLWECG